jgi:hypothetical protein
MVRGCEVVGGWWVVGGSMGKYSDAGAVEIWRFLPVRGSVNGCLVPSAVCIRQRVPK